MECYLNDDCISIIKKYSRDYTRTELYSIYMEIQDDITCYFYKNYNIKFVYGEEDLLTVIQIKIPPSEQYDFNLQEKLFFKWLMFQNNTSEKYKKYFENKQNYMTSLKIFNFIDKIIKLYNFTDIELELFKEVIYEDYEDY